MKISQIVHLRQQNIGHLKVLSGFIMPIQLVFDWFLTSKGILILIKVFHILPIPSRRWKNQDPNGMVKILYRLDSSTRNMENTKVNEARGKSSARLQSSPIKKHSIKVNYYTYYRQYFQLIFKTREDY